MVTGENTSHECAMVADGRGPGTDGPRIFDATPRCVNKICASKDRIPYLGRHKLIHQDSIFYSTVLRRRVWTSHVASSLKI